MDVKLIENFLNIAAKIMADEKVHLIEEDSIVGDGDLGLTMSDGFEAAAQSLIDNPQSDCGKALYFAGKAMSIKVPSTMGTLMASGLMQAGKVLKGKEQLSREDIVSIFEEYLNGVMNRGKAKIGEKTFVDGLYPAVESLKSSVDKPLKESAKLAEEAAMEGYQNTKGMLAVHGRAATRGEDSKKLLDPGALVAALLMKAFAQSINE